MNASNKNNFENYAALLVSIIRRVSPEEAFMLLNPDTTKRKRKWTKEDFMEVQKRKTAGETWSEIAITYGKTANALRQSYYNYTKSQGYNRC